MTAIIIESDMWYVICPDFYKIFKENMLKSGIKQLTVVSSLLSEQSE